MCRRQTTASTSTSASASTSTSAATSTSAEAAAAAATASSCWPRLTDEPIFIGYINWRDAMKKIDPMQLVAVKMCGENFSEFHNFK